MPIPLEGENWRVRIKPIKNTLNISVELQKSPNEGNEQKRVLDERKQSPSRTPTRSEFRSPIPLRQLNRKKGSNKPRIYVYISRQTSLKS